MPNYKEEALSSGNSFVRASKIEIFNTYGKPQRTIAFTEEQIINIGTELIRRGYARRVSGSPVGEITLRNTLTAENANTSFNILDPVDNTVTGTMTYQDVYNVLYSLYIHTATEFDTANP